MIAIRQAVILAGGRGERLMPLTMDRPKPMVLINNKPFLDYLIYSLIEQGIKKIIILTGYKSKIISQRYNNYKDIQILCIQGDEIYETGQRIIKAYEYLEDHFLLLYGDNYCKINLNKMTENFFNKKKLLSTTVFSNKKGTGEYGNKNNIIVNKDNIIEGYDKEMKNSKSNGVDIGYFIVNKKIFNFKYKGNPSFEKTIVNELIKKKQISGYITDEQYYYLTNTISKDNFEKYVILNNINHIKV